MLLRNLINDSGFDLYYLTNEKFLDLDQDFGLINLRTLYNPTINSANSGQLLSLPQTEKFILHHSPNRQIAIIPFKPSAKIDLVCRLRHWRLIANPASLNRQLEDKIKFVSFCRQANIPILPSEVAPLTAASFSQFQHQFSQESLVIQTHFGWAGKSTCQANSYTTAIKTIPPGTIVKFSPFTHGYTLLNNCCLVQSHLLQSPPALQFTGIHPYTTNPFTTVGRQWPSFAPPEVQDQVYHLTQQVAHHLSVQKYRGFFGLDFIVNQQNQVFLVEINPRLTASFSFYTQLELKSGLTPLFFYHLSEFLGLDFPFRQSESKRFYNTHIQGTEITPKNSAGQTITRHHFSNPLVKSPDPELQPIALHQHLTST